MFSTDVYSFVFMCSASALAGFIDALVGGGGLILVPALLLGLPATTPLPTLLGTNKLAAISGTTVAAHHFLKNRLLTARQLVAPVLCAGAFSALGAFFTTRLKPEIFRPLMLVLMTLMLAFTLARSRLGQHHVPRWGPRHERPIILVIAAFLGFYDGFFGPGTGSMLVFLFVSILGYDFLRASALAKPINWGSNLAATTLFVLHGNFIAPLALALAVTNIMGGQLGAQLAMKGGSRWIRITFLVVVTALIVRLAWQHWLH